jgi:uncharacterized membrane protein HdeD (DUF308 family)
MAITEGKSIWLTIEGGVLILLGVLALISPIFAGLAAAALFGWLLIMVGLLGLIAAFAGRAHAHLGWGMASAAIALIVGVMLLFNPMAGAVGLGILIGAYFLLDGISLVGLGLDHRKRGMRAWSWLLAAGVFDILLAAFILTLGAIGSTVLVGVLVGVDLIVAGIALLMIHRAGRGPAAGWIDPADTAPRPR